MSLFWELHSGLPREGAGDDEATEHMLSLLPQRRYSRILDAGCGPGAQTLCLARNLDGEITAVDTHQPFLDVLADQAQSTASNIAFRTANASMDSLPFEGASFDLIWSEGAIYCIGFERRVYCGADY